MKRTLLSLLLIASLMVASAQQKLSFTLEEAIETALTNNYSQQIMEVSHLGSEEDLAQARRDLLPDLSGSLSQAYGNQGNSGTYSVNASVVVWRGGQGVNAIRRNQIALNQSDTKIAQSQNDLTINVIRSFLTVLMNDELYKYQSDVVGISGQQKNIGEARYRSGQILESDYLLLVSQYANDNYSLTNSRVNRDNALIELKNLLSIDAESEIEIIAPASELSPEALDMPTLQELIEETLAWLPDLRLTTLNIELAQMDTKIARGALAPTVSLGGSLGTRYSNQGGGSWGTQFADNHSQQISLSISIPLWSKGKTRSNIAQNEYRLQQAELEAMQTQLNLRNSLEKEYSNVVSLREKYVAAQSSSNAYEQTFKVFSAQFDAGAINTTDLLQQQNNYLSSLNNYLQSKYSYLLNRKILDVYMGNEIKI